MANYYGNDVDNLQVGGFVNYYGGDGRDWLAGGAAGPHELYGGAGNDVLFATNFLTFTGSGTLADPWVFTTFVPSGVGAYLEGGAGDDTIYGTDGDDVIYGGDGNDSGVIQGYNGVYDVGGLYGGAGDDEMYGGKGDDWITGGTGKDNMWGGSDADTFFFNAPNETGNSKLSADVIHDFSRGEGDKVDLSGMGIDFDFIGKRKFSDDGDPELRFKKGYLYGDTDGDGDKDFMIKVIGVTKMKADDFEI